MDDISGHGVDGELPQQLGVKADEANSFVARSRRQSGTATDIIEPSEVPWTRVSDANRGLDTMELVELQYSNPKRHRAVPVDGAANIRRDQ